MTSDDMIMMYVASMNLSAKVRYPSGGTSVSKLNWKSTAAIRHEAVSRILFSKTELVLPYMSIPINEINDKKKIGIKTSKPNAGSLSKLTEKTYCE